MTSSTSKVTNFDFELKVTNEISFVSIQWYNSQQKVLEPGWRPAKFDQLWCLGSWPKRVHRKTVTSRFLKWKSSTITTVKDLYKGNFTVLETDTNASCLDYEIKRGDG